MSTVFTFEEFEGYTFEITGKPNNVGTTLTCTVYDKDNKEITSCSGAYGNGSGYGYCKQGIIEGAKYNLKKLIENNFKEEVTEPYDENFLYILANEGYIADYGNLKNSNELVIMFDSWSQVEGRSEFNKDKNEWEVVEKSVYTKLRELADKNLLKPSINRTIKEVEFVFTDEYTKCYDCGAICDNTWDGVTWLEERYEYLCNDCVNSDTDVIRELITNAQEDFHKAVGVVVSENTIENLGFEKLYDEKDFSTRYSQWGESSYGCFDTDVNTVERICKEYDGFAKLTHVGQFDCEYTLYFPSETVELARQEFGISV